MKRFFTMLRLRLKTAIGRGDLLVALREDGRVEVRFIASPPIHASNGLVEAQNWLLSDLTIRAVTVYDVKKSWIKLELSFMCRIVRQTKSVNDYFRQWNEFDTTHLTNLAPLLF